MESVWNVQIDILASAKGIDLDRWAAILRTSPRIDSELVRVEQDRNYVVVEMTLIGARNTTPYGPQEALKSALVLLNRSAKRLGFTRSITPLITLIQISRVTVVPDYAKKGSE